MNAKRITEGIYYVGVNDRATERFEAMWPLPYGVSYNSYLVRGSERTAIIDAVEIDTLTKHVRHIEHDTKADRIDYLVVNHTEPDHSGSIPYLLAHYSDMKIVCNKIAAEQIKGFYGVTDDERFHIVSDGDTLSLGDMTLKFISTPMVHWPETMMTFCPERKVLFAGDAFGCFGALNGFVTDDDMDDELFGLYRDEMYRYYSNIVAKYGKFVQAAIAKILPLEVEYACSTHGPVWHKRLHEVASLYTKAAAWEAEDGVVIVYASMYGNTGTLVDSLCDSLRCNGHKRIIVHNANNVNLSYILRDCVRYKTLIIGSPTYSMDILPAVASVVRALGVREIKNKQIGVFGSFTWANGGLPKLTAAFTEMNLPPKATLAMKHARLSEIEKDIDTFVKAL